MKSARFLSLLLALTLLVACGGGDGSTTDASPTITDIEWKWQQTQFADGKKMRPAEPGNYTLRLGSDGKLALQVDCNRAGGNYRLEDSQLTLNVTHSTRAMCPPDSLDQDFLRQLAAVAIYFLRDGDLYLDMKMDSGTMKFSR